MFCGATSSFCVELQGVVEIRQCAMEIIAQRSHRAAVDVCSAERRIELDRPCNRYRLLPARRGFWKAQPQPKCIHAAALPPLSNVVHASMTARDYRLRTCNRRPYWKTQAPAA